MIDYREATLGDAPIVARVVMEGMHTSLYSNTPPSELRPFEYFLERWQGYMAGTRHPRLANAPRVVFLAADDGKVVGIAAFHHTTKWGVEGELQSIYILKPYLRRGIGTALFRLGVVWLRHGGKNSMGVDVHPTNPYRRFYEKLGGYRHNDHTYVWRSRGHRHRTID